MRPVPWWTVFSAAVAPAVLAGAWILAAAQLPRGADLIRDTMSGLAAHGQTDPRIITGGLAGLGVCHLITSLGLRPLAAPGRLTLALGGAAALLATAVPQPTNGSATGHGVIAAVGFVAMAVWPALCVLGTGGQPPLPPAVFLTATAALLALVGWFGAELLFTGGRAGLAERVTAGAETLWPLVVAVTLRAAASQPQTETSKD